MKLFTHFRRELLGKTFMDLAKAFMVAAGIFSASMKIRLMSIAIVAILIFIGLLLYPAKKEEKGHA